jgi:methylmalonyl-CoA mutase cobalamin-binding subunit
MNSTATPGTDASLWNIAEIERDTGLGKDVLRVWERRYGFPQPLRDARGDRLYDQPTLDRLLLIKRLLDAGHRPGQVVALPAPELQAMLQSRCTQPDGTGKPAAALASWRELLEPDSPGALRMALRQQVQGLGLADTIEQLLAPLGQQIGAAWMAGELTIHQEHLFSEAVQAVLRESIAALDLAPGHETGAPRVLLTTLAQEQHQLGLLMAECFFALERCERIALGLNMPLAEILASATHYRVDIVALSISPYAAAREVGEQLERLRDQLPAGVELWIGGGWTQGARRRLPAGVQRVLSAAQVGAGVARWRTLHASDGRARQTRP